MLIPREHWHTHIGRPVVVHTVSGHYRGHLQHITPQHIVLHGHRLAAGTGEDPNITTLDAAPEPSVTPAYYYNPAVLAIPLAGIMGITALGLTAMGLW